MKLRLRIRIKQPRVNGGGCDTGGVGTGALLPTISPRYLPMPLPFLSLLTCIFPRQRRISHLTIFLLGVYMTRQANSRQANSVTLLIVYGGAWLWHILGPVGYIFDPPMILKNNETMGLLFLWLWMTYAHVGDIFAHNSWGGSSHTHECGGLLEPFTILSGVAWLRWHLFRILGPWRSFDMAFGSLIRT